MTVVICGTCEWVGEVERSANVCPKCKRKDTLCPPLLPVEDLAIVS